MTETKKSAKLKSVRNHFAAGLLVLAPLFLTIVVISYLVRMADAFVVNPLFSILPLHMDVSSRILLAKVLIAAVVFVVVTMIGWAAQRFLFKRIFSVGEAVLENIPIINKIYASIRDITVALFGDKKGAFGRVVFVNYPYKGSYTVGFVTNDNRWEIDEKTGKEMLTVFIPSPPNPATGFFVFVPREDVIDSTMTIEEGMRLVLSIGAAVPGQKKE
jgi:uncharacterized membrane protein